MTVRSTAHVLYEVTEATWPPAQTVECGPFTLRDGAGGGKRVSAATLRDGAEFSDAALNEAETQMRAMGQKPLFMIRDGEADLDVALADAGYQVIDPVQLYSIQVEKLCDLPIPRVMAFTIWEPLAIMKDLWAEAGIGPERLAVMARVKSTKTGVLGRIDDQPGATAFVAVHDGIAMLHALEVREKHRRKGLAQWIMRQAAIWARDNGARELAVLCVQRNVAANALYTGLGFAPAGTYHYRIRES